MRNSITLDVFNVLINIMNYFDISQCFECRVPAENINPIENKAQDKRSQTEGVGVKVNDGEIKASYESP